MTEHTIDLPDGPLLQKLADYIVANPQAAAHIQGFLEGKGETIGTCRLEITAARLVLSDPEQGNPLNSRSSPM